MEVADLDLTNRHLNSLESVEIDPNFKSVDLTCNRLTELDARILALTGLTMLNLRQNLLENANFTTALASASCIKDLELRDNLLTQVPSLGHLTALTRLELSYNQIRSAQPLEQLQAPQLQQLYMACNKLQSMEGIRHLTALQIIEMGSNRIRKIEHLEGMTALEELWLGHNRVADMEGMASLVSLKKLSLQANRLTSISGLEACTALQELCLPNNGIKEIQGISQLTNLRLLDLSSNLLTSIQGLPPLPFLLDLWLNNNQLTELKELEPHLAPLKATVTCIYLEGNPLAKEGDYRQSVSALLPNLKQLDADDV